MTHRSTLPAMQTTRPADWRRKPPAGQVEPRLLHPACSKQRDQPMRGLLWCPVVAPRTLPQAPCSQAATQPTALEPEPSTPPPAKRRKRTKAEQAAEPTQPTARLPKPSEHHSQAAHWGEQVAAAGAVLLARPGSAASQGQGVPWPGLQVAARQAS
ncbi:hypothetical protein HaLaN_05201 [Haematococcus lacustris]|uniref:Uncharacterized protein n=1 Tax=Haematococcus lacustris TaxID=44745 RepID=A0A699YSR1_HAELA|nr:hypothetical protein HaLaN_05201 [Haematococcus lacustris]